jgi:hypothetical protein
MEYVNGKCVHALLSMVSGMNLGLKYIYIYSTSLRVCETCTEEQQLRTVFFL